MKMTVCQYRKGSGFLDGSWRHVRNHKILLVQVTVVRFSLTKIKHTKVAKAMRSSSKQNKNMKLWDVLEVMLFISNLLLCCQLHWAWPKQKIKAWLYGKKHRNSLFLVWIHFRCYRDTKTEKNLLAVWTLFNYNISDGCPLWLYHFIGLALHENENKTS